MPGTLQVSVLEALGLPTEGDTGSLITRVFVKVSVGGEVYTTRQETVLRGITSPWNTDFAFGVVNPTDRVLVAVCDAAGDVVCSCAIDFPSIDQDWYRDEYVPLDEKGRIHLTLNFVTVTREEPERLEYMRATAARKGYKERRDDMLREYDFKRKEDLCVNNGLRTIAENALVHAGQPLDDWEVFSWKKGKEDLPHADRDLEHVQAVTPPPAKEVLRNSTKGGAPNVMKDVTSQQPRGLRENALAPTKASENTQLPRLRYGKSRSLPSPPINSPVTEQGLQQQPHHPGSSNGSCAKLLPPQTPGASLDEWVCVERPPMTWEEALKVAQKARETVAGTPPTPPPLHSLSAATPASSLPSRKSSTPPQTLPGRGPAAFAPLPLPPKQSPGRMSRGGVTARVNSFDSNLHQGPDPTTSRLENEKARIGSTPRGTAAIAARDKRVVGGERSKMSEGRRTNKEPPPSTRDRANGEESSKTNQDRKEKGPTSSQILSSARVNSATDQHQKPRLPDGCQTSRFDKPTAAVGSLGSRGAGNSSTLGQSSDTRTAWRLPELQDINVEALESQLAQNSLTEEEFVSGLQVDGSLSPMNVHDDEEEECGKFLDQVNSRLMSHIHGSAARIAAAAVEEQLQGEKGEEDALAAVDESPLPGEGRKVTFMADVVEHDTKVTLTANVVAAQDSKVIPGKAEAHAEGHQGGHMVTRGPARNCSKTTSPNPAAPSDRLQQNASRSGDSVWKSFQDDSSNPPWKSVVISGSLYEKVDQTSAFSNRLNSKSVDEAFAAAARQIFREQSRPVLGNRQPPPCPPVPSGDKLRGSGGAESNVFSHLGSGVKQVLTGAVILAGLFALWPRSTGPPAARYHVVKAGETLSSIAPGQCSDSTSNFCRINPKVCDQKTIYPGQRIRLS